MDTKNSDAKNAAKGCLILLLIPAVFLAVVCVSGLLRYALASHEQRAEWAGAAAEEQRIKEIEDAFSPWDGAHVELKKIIKATMQDPGSFECLDSRWIEMGNGNIKVTMVYSGKNAFGARVQDTTTAECLVSGAVLRVY